MTLVYIFKLVEKATYIAFAVLFFSIGAYFVVQLYLLLYKINRKHIKIKINKHLDFIRSINGHVPEQILRFFKRHVVELLECLANRTDTLNAEVSNCLLLRARKLTRSKRWLNQYFATQCYRYAFTNADEPFLINLVSSQTLLVSLNAAEIIFQHPTQKSIDALIDNFYQGRSLNRSLCVEILANVQPINVEMIGNFINTKISNSIIVSQQF